MADPMYRQIAEELRRQIESGELEPGVKLPTELQLRELFDNASRNTVRDAIRSLLTQGLVTTRPGQGTFVAHRIEPFQITLSRDTDTGLGGGEGIAYRSAALAQQRKPEASTPEVKIQAADEVPARELRVPAGTSLICRHQVLRIDKKPWSMQTSFYPIEFAAKAPLLIQAVDIEQGTVRYVAETLGFEQVGYQDQVSARPPNSGEVSFFKLPEAGVVVIETIRTAYERSGQPIRCTVTVWPADRNRLVYNIGEVPKEIASPPPSNDPGNGAG
ncbi:GntR family transcriptional regulator [Actinoplanes sp. L3-i22]|uniref:GntR family transcriptional regulator n=1 Tax=Actinoplanes sp. L3-i22 TaxID=2836373 RepID=UPI001C77482A|nr:GntR family transcriptional regulator [Actinoplanes sp. L3-i22]BCY13585.1 GntR family transcriptional regulator [Actinoplanes sp. L3-i22]